MAIEKKTKEEEKPQYKWNVAQFKLPGSDEIITAEEAATDSDLIELLLSIEGQGIIQKLI